jgi:hypothetical protein
LFILYLYFVDDVIEFDSSPWKFEVGNQTFMSQPPAVHEKNRLGIPPPTRHGPWADGFVWLGFWPLGLVKAITTTTVLQICPACTIDYQIWWLYILCSG